MAENTTKLFELWFRAAFKSALQRGEITTAIRPGDRRYPSPKGTRAGELVRIRILSKPGDEQKGTMPEFDSFESLARIKRIEVKRLGELKKSELEKCLPNCQDKEKARHELGLIYNKEFNDNDIVSIIYFNYINEE